MILFKICNFCYSPIREGNLRCDKCKPVFAECTSQGRRRMKVREENLEIYCKGGLAPLITTDFNLYLEVCDEK